MAPDRQNLHLADFNTAKSLQDKVVYIYTCLSTLFNHIYVYVIKLYIHICMCTYICIHKWVSLVLRVLGHSFQVVLEGSQQNTASCMVSLCSHKALHISCMQMCARTCALARASRNILQALARPCVFVRAHLRVRMCVCACAVAFAYPCVRLCLHEAA